MMDLAALLRRQPPTDEPRPTGPSEPEAAILNAEPASEMTLVVPDPAAEDGTERPSVRRLAAILMSGALLSKLLGFVREVLMAQVIGTSLVADGFRGAMTAIFIPLVFLQNESVPAILIPMHRDAQKEGHAAAHLTSMALALTFVAGLLTLAVEIGAEWWVDTVLGGFTAERRTLTVEFVRIMALAMPASTLLNCYAAGEIAMGRTQLTNIRAGLQNISVIFGILLIAVTGRFGAIAWAFSFAFNALGIWATWSLARRNMLNFSGAAPSLVFAAGVEFIQRLRPLFALPLAEQAQIWIERILASRLVTGSVASLDYARTLTESALLLISQPVGLAVLSTHQAKDTQAQVERIARPLLAVGLPVSAFLAAFAPEIIRFVFLRGAFTEEGVLLTSQALRGISFGLWAATLGWILLRVLNSTGRNVTAALILVCAYAANISLNLLTSLIPAADSHGLLYLGLGETMRGLVMLGGIAIALKCGFRILGLTCLALLPAALMLLLSGQIHAAFVGTFVRLVVGGWACIGCILIASAMLMQESWRMAFRMLRARFAGPWGRMP